MEGDLKVCQTLGQTWVRLERLKPKKFEPCRTIEMNGAQPVLPPEPPRRCRPFYRRDSVYPNIFKNWNAGGNKSLRRSSSVERLEHRIFKRFFFDVLEALHNLSSVDALNAEIKEMKMGKIYVNSLKDQSAYILHSLLLLVQTSLFRRFPVRCNWPTGKRSMYG
ncbi:hypothetical protein HK102_011618 [Quaeritorhiza haematococci]|nr:hypothetical protein HK102_011618 [Quaeritorhiza haematococci]